MTGDDVVVLETNLKPRLTYSDVPVMYVIDILSLI